MDRLTKHTGTGGALRPPVVMRDYMLAVAEAAKVYKWNWRHLKTHLLGMRRQLDYPDCPVVLQCHDVVRATACTPDEAWDSLVAVAEKIDLPMGKPELGSAEGAQTVYIVDFRTTIPLLFCETEQQRNRLKNELDWLLGKRRPIPEDPCCLSVAMLVLLRALVPDANDVLVVGEEDLVELLGVPLTSMGYALTMLQANEVITVERTLQQRFVIQFQ